MHDELATTAQRHALYGGDGRHLRILQRLRGTLEFLDGLFQHVELAGGTGLANLLQVGTHGERRFVPDDDAVQRRFRLADGSNQAVEHFVADGVHLGLEGNDADLAVDRRQAP